MDFLNNINEETLIITTNGIKKKILEKNLFINIKIMTIEEVLKKYLFTYDERAILYLMNKYLFKYDIAKVYLDNLIYVEDTIYNEKKLDILVNIKKELEQENLLIYNSNFKKYIENVKIIIYGIKIDKFIERTLAKCNYQIILRKYNQYKHNVLSFSDMESEVEYVAYKISDLIYNGIKPDKIKLTNVDNSYFVTIERIFKLYNLRVNITHNRRLASFPYIKNFIDIYESNDLNTALNNIDKDNLLYKDLINVINQYIKYHDKNLIIYKIKEKVINDETYTNGIEIIDYLDYIAQDSEYIFMLGFNDGLIPRSYKDDNYITDSLCNKVNLYTTYDKNKLLREDILNAISDIKNLYITYKEKDSKKTFYPSTLLNNFKVIKGVIPNDISYSEINGKIKLTKLIDSYIKYGIENEELILYKNFFKTNYNSYNNQYKKFSFPLDKIRLSYSKMQIYNKCAFRYYLTDILKLDIYEENFSAIIGKMVHYVLEKCLKNIDYDIYKYSKEFISTNNYIFNNKEKFFIEKYKNELNNFLNNILDEYQYSSFDKALYEEKIDIELDNNISFTGVIDKILYKEENNKTYVSLVDYKTGNDIITLDYIKYGINMQLPIYLYLASNSTLKNIIYTGFYLQKFNINDKDYRLIGYSNSDRDILNIIDNNYVNSKVIKGMKINQNGEFSRYAKVLSSEEIEKIIKLTKEKIIDTVENIKNNEFTINPKVTDKLNIGCEFCCFKDICFMTNKDIVKIFPNELEDDN